MWDTDEARDFYVNSGGNQFDDIVGLGDDFELIEAGMSYGSNKSKKTSAITGNINDYHYGNDNSNSSCSSGGIANKGIDFWIGVIIVILVLI